MTEDELRIVSLREHLAEATEIAFNVASPHTVAIVTLDRNQSPDFIGSGVFFELEDQVILLTASHVIDEMKDGILALKDGVETIPSKVVRTLGGDCDYVDAAYWKVDRAFPALIGAEPVPGHRLFGNRTFEDPFPCFSGYPASKNKLGKAINIGEKRITSYCFLFAATIAEANYQQHNKNTMCNIALQYGKGRDSSGNLVTPPYLQGMSGGPLWFAKDHYTTDRLYLAGILTEYHEKTGQLVFCTRIERILDFVTDSFQAT